MHIFLGVLAAVTLAVGIGSCSLAKGAIHEIESLVWMLMSAVFFSGAAIVHEIRTLHKPLSPPGGEMSPKMPEAVARPEEPNRVEN